MFKVSSEYERRERRRLPDAVLSPRNRSNSSQHNKVLRNSSHIADEVASQVTWENPWYAIDEDEDGVRFEVPLKNDQAEFFFIVHLPGRDDVPRDVSPVVTAALGGSITQRCGFFRVIQTSTSQTRRRDTRSNPLARDISAKEVTTEMMCR
jgi:hypothetical protein